MTAKFYLALAFAAYCALFLGYYIAKQSHLGIAIFGIILVFETKALYKESVNRDPT